jgi:hypothetical protein
MMPAVLPVTTCSATTSTVTKYFDKKCGHHKITPIPSSFQPFYNYKASILSSSHILAAFRGFEEFRSADHVSVVGEVRKELKHCTKLSNDMDLASIVDKLPCDDGRAVAVSAALH